MKNIKLKNTIYAIGLIATGLFFGWFFFGGEQTNNTDHSHETLAEVWTCSMHPQVRQTEAGQCPFCGMDLIPLGETEDVAALDEIQMTNTAMKLADISTVIVKKGIAQKNLELSGKIAVDERSVIAVPAHFAGRVEKLYADYTGQVIKVGQKLATIYSPDLVLAQKELLEAEKFKDRNPTFFDAAIQKLKRWDFSDRQIQEILENKSPIEKLDIYSHDSGTIFSKKISQGDHVMDGMVMFEIANLNKLWVIFDAYESDLAWIKLGDVVEFQAPSLPGETFKSKITFIDPSVRADSRTVAIRAEISNPKGILKPDMFAEGILSTSYSGSNDDVSIPKTAVLWTGKRAIIYVKVKDTENPTFQFREIELGPETDDSYIVKSGLVEGEEVAINGVFKIDAAAQLQGKKSMMNPEVKKVDYSFGSDKLGIKKEDDLLQNFAVNEEFKLQLKDVFTSYLLLKDALVATDINNSIEANNSLTESLKKVDANLISGEAKEEWLRDLSILNTATMKIKGEEDIEQTRASFSSLSDQLFQSIKKFEVETGAYRQYCPMAFNNEGAFWLSDSDKILNPYFGDAMLNCGSVDQKLK